MVRILRIALANIDLKKKIYSACLLFNSSRFNDELSTLNIGIVAVRSLVCVRKWKIKPKSQSIRSMKCEKLTISLDKAGILWMAIASKETIKHNLPRAQSSERNNNTVNAWKWKKSRVRCMAWNELLLTISRNINVIVLNVYKQVYPLPLSIMLLSAGSCDLGFRCADNKSYATKCENSFSVRSINRTWEIQS